MNYERNWVLPSLFRKGEKVLDLGCGDGVVSEYLQKEIGSEVVGADISKEALAIAKKRGVDVRLVNAEKTLPFKDGEFDTVFWGDNVEHLFNPEYTLAQIKRVLKKGGRLVLSCPNMGYWRYRIHFFLKGSLPDTEWTGNPPWAWSHIRFFNGKIVGDFLASKEFRITKVKGVNKRFPDKFFLNFLPGLFGMIFIVEAVIDAK
ncbi:class I SAM-dependent methyltransferase [Candidatus Daviesbacteria bacterium]|nr:class I SAM-dependent methyltransferase [Candidatus Daviesbacteria bacterium]